MRPHVALGPTTPAFTPGEEAVRRTVATVAKDGYYMQEWTVIEHIGTHVDAPGHFAAGGRTADRLSISELITPAVVIDISARAAKDPDAWSPWTTCRAFERRHDRIPQDAAVLMYSGWGAKVGDPTPTAARGPGRTLHFPGVQPRRRGLAAAPPEDPQPGRRTP